MNERLHREDELSALASFLGAYGCLGETSEPFGGLRLSRILAKFGPDCARPGLQAKRSSEILNEKRLQAEDCSSCRFPSQGAQDAGEGFMFKHTRGHITSFDLSAREGACDLDFFSRVCLSLKCP